MNCFANCGREGMRNNTLCLECSLQTHLMERERMVTFRREWISELKFQVLLCAEDGWYPWVSRECREWFISKWPDYTQKKGFEQNIYELQEELGITPTVPRWVNLCPCTLEMGRAVNRKFEELAEGWRGGSND